MPFSRPSFRLALLPAAVLMACSGAASAAAFQLWEQNASGIATAYAGSAAVADNASTIYYNPAGMTQLKGVQLSVGVAGVNPNFKFKDSGSSVAGSAGGDAGGGFHIIPNAYAAMQLTSDLSVGLGISSPFALSTDYQDNNWIGARQATKSKITTVNFNPSVAYKLNDKVSLGLGLNYQKIDAEMNSSLAALKGDDSAWGWNAGALFTLSPSMRVGLSYRSAIKYELEGTQTPTGAAAVPVKAKLTLPDTFILSVWQQVSDRWEAMGDLSYTNWSTVNRLDIYNQSTGAYRNSEQFGYKDAWRFAWGAAYKVSEQYKVKFGIAYDKTPTTNSDRSARVPDNNRIWLSTGVQWKPAQNTTIDAGYAYLYLKDPEVNRTENGTGTTLRGRYSDSGHVLGIQFSQGF